MDTVSYNIIQNARQYATMECYRNSFNLYIMAMENYPRVKKIVEFEFRIVLMKLNEYLTVVENNKREILTNFEAAMRAFPGNVNLLSDIGKYLFQYSYFYEALVHFEKALSIDASLVSIEKTLDIAKKVIFSRAHFRVLNDKRRNRAYLQAIREIVMPNAECVIDADTGPGLSALYANACAAASTTACDVSHNMAKLAERIMNENNVQDILVINKPPTQLNLNDVYGQRTLLITNKFDSGLFGDHLLLTLKHAWENLLSEFGRVMPGRAEYFLVGAKCDRISLKYHVSTAAKELLNVPHLYIHAGTHTRDSYYGEDLNLYDDIEYVTDPQLLMQVNFNNYYDITKKMRTTLPHVAILRANKDTEVNVIVGYFKLYLTESIILTTDPCSPERTGAWQQAVFFDYIPAQMKKNALTAVQILTYGGKLKFLPDLRRSITRLSPPAVAFLNDAEYMEAIVRSVPIASIYLGQIAATGDLEIADLCPFPLFGLQMMKRGAKSLICYARHFCDKLFFEKVFTLNDVPLCKVTILVGNYWNHTAFKDKVYHAIFCNALDLGGDVDVRLSRAIQHLKYGHLETGGLVMPANIGLVGQLISSNWLDKHNRMSDDEKSSFRLASQVNLFQASQAHCIDPTRLKYRALSDPYLMSTCVHTMRSEVVSVPVISDGVCNAVLCWYEVQLLESDEAITTNRSNSFVDSTAFLAIPKVKMYRGDSVNVIRSVDCDGSYKMVIDLDIAQGEMD